MSTSNTKHYGLIVLLSVIMAFGCGETKSPPPKIGVQKWKPFTIGGPLELRTLPQADAVLNDYDMWVNADTSSKARIYELKMDAKEKQFNYTVEYRREQSPLGSAEHTYVTFF